MITKVALLDTEMKKILATLDEHNHQIEKMYKNIEKIEGLAGRIIEYLQEKNAAPPSLSDSLRPLTRITPSLKETNRSL